MVEKQRPRSGSRYSLKPQIAAALSALPPLGYKAPPPLIGVKTMKSDVQMLRARNYAKAYKTLSVKEWNSYVAFGIQQFASPSKYLATRDSESEHSRNLRLARYYRLHLENNAPIDKFLMSKIVGIEAALQTPFPGYFDMSVAEMDEYVSFLGPFDLQQGTEETFNFSPPTEITESQQDIEMSNILLQEDNSLQIVVTKVTTSNNDLSDTPMDQSTVPMFKSSAQNEQIASLRRLPPMLKNTVKCDKLTPTVLPPTIESFQEALKSITKATTDAASMVPMANSLPPAETAAYPTGSSPTITHVRKRKKKAKTTIASSAPAVVFNRPSAITEAIRIEARWAPKDFNALKGSTALMYSRLAPLLTRFNNHNSWMLEWQTDQLAEDQTIPASQLSKFLSIRVAAVMSQQCFYFSFRVNSTGKQITQVLQSKELKQAKRGESLTLDPSFIPVHQGEIVNIGDILLKDASVTHRSNYLKYLRKDVLLSDVPSFDLKIRHKDPAGQKIPILTVRCGKSVATSVAHSLSIALNGEGTNPEIFISRLALGANQIEKGEHEKIYKVHHEYLADVVFIPFTASRYIDQPVIEHLESGETITRSPRQWAKSLVDSNGQSLEVDLDSGTTDGSAVLITSSASHHQTLQELNKYWQRQNPALAHATKMYADTVLHDPDIPMTVFTRNIETILAKKIKRTTASAGSDGASTFLSPESSITGVTSKSSKGPIAWKVPLQETMQRQEYHKASHKKNNLNAREQSQQERIAYLEQQLESMSANNSKTSSTMEHQSKRSQSRASHASSQLSGNSPTLTIASAHARLDGIETAVMSIQTMLTTLTTRSSSTPPTVAQEGNWPSFTRSPPPPTMAGIQLFSDSVVLSSLSTPVKKTSTKRRKPTASPDLRLQYTDSMDSSGEGSF